MSKQFYKYLSYRVIEHFDSSGIGYGEKFNITLETEEKVREFYKALKESSRSKNFNYNGVYETFELTFGDTGLIVAATLDGVTEDYLTRLRNMISEANKRKGILSKVKGFIKSDPLEKKSILFIHNSTLDSIIGGSESLSKKGMPLNIGEIKKDIKNKARKFEESEREVMNFALERFSADGHLDNSSIFEYVSILQVLDSGSITREHYKDFGLFIDSDLSTFKGKELRKRIKENSEFYSIVETAHQYGNIEEDLQDLFDEGMVKKLGEKEWRSLEYSNLQKSNSKRKEDGKLDFYEPSEKEKVTGEELICWEQGEGDSKAKKRKRNLLIFNPEKKERVTFEYRFGKHLKQEFVQKPENISVKASGKKILLEMESGDTDIKWGKFSLANNSEKYDFKVMVINLPEETLRELKGRWNLSFKRKKEEKFIEIKNFEGTISINNNETFEVEEVILDANKEISIDNLQTTLKLVSGEIDEEVKLEVNLAGEKISLAIREEVPQKKEITGSEIWRLKNDAETDFLLPLEEYSEENNKVIFKEKEYFAKAELKKYILLEKEIIKNGGVYFEKQGKHLLKEIEIDIPAELKEIYSEIIEHFRKVNTIPSFANVDGKLKGLYERYIEAYFKALSELDHSDKVKERHLFRVGMLKQIDGEKEILLSPLHPLNIAYQLETKELIKGDKLKPEISHRLRSDNLLPYLYSQEERLYKVFEQVGAPEWTVYVSDELNRYNSSKEYVVKLVRDKIEEFRSHFSYLFDLNIDSPIKVNLINMGDCKEVLEGIFAYYTRELDKKTPEKLLPLEVYIYSESDEITAFEEISYLKSVEEVKDRYNLRLSTKNYSEEDVIEVFRERVHFFKKDKTDLEYAHLSFYEMEKNEVSKTYEDVNELNTGVSLNGVVSSLMPIYVGKSYKTGFGLKGNNVDNKLMKIAKKLNELARVSENLDPYEKDKVIATAISEDYRQNLDEVYRKSHWVTFVDPKVDINFFKNNSEEDLVIIHYSDQYTNTSGYDAITVTKRSKLYEKIIQEFLGKKLEDSELDFSTLSNNLINYFNAVNGDWLLRLSKSNNESAREKISLLSAVKSVQAFLNTGKVIWIPISLEELFRISGGAGLSQRDGILSAKNLGIEGSCSDDLLFIGIEDGVKPKLRVYPVEVKIGKNKKAVKAKAREQAKKALEAFNEIFSGEEFNSKFYKNFLIQVLYATIERLKLYGFGEEKKLEKILESNLKSKLFNGEYEFIETPEERNGSYGVVSFEHDNVFREIKKEEDHMFFKFTENDGYRLLDESIESIRRDYLKISEVEPEEEIESSEENTLNLFIDPVEPLKEEEVFTLADYPQDTPEEEEGFSLFDHLESKPSAGMKIKLGIDEMDNQEYYWYPNNTEKLMHPNTGIMGTMGTGKTQFTKSLITQLNLNSKDNPGDSGLGILIFDYKGDYIKEDFVKLNKAKVYDLYHLPFNPMDIYKGKGFKPLLPLHTANNLKVTISKAFNLGKVQETTLQHLIMDAYEGLKGISKANPSTWDKPAPTFKDLYELHTAREDVKMDSLYAALSKVAEFEIFHPNGDETKPLFDLIEGVTVINLSGYDSDLQNLVVAITLDIFYSQMQAKGHSNIDGKLREITNLILVDEADNFLSQNFSSIRKILKEGREFGVGTILSTQFLDHFSTSENEYSDYIETWVVHKVAKLSGKEVRTLFGAKNKSEEEEYIQKIKDLEKHYSLIKAGNDQIRYVKDWAFWQLQNEY